MRAGAQRWSLVACCAGLLLAGCGPQSPAATPQPSVSALTQPAQQYQALQHGARGLAVGPASSDYTVYVLFDPQCLHCARLWQESQPLRASVRFVWVPVSFFDARSTAQSAALLAADDPLAALEQLSAAVLARSPMPPTPDHGAPELEAAVKANTDLIGRFHVLGVPYIVARNQTTSAYVAHQGVMSRDVLTRFLGLGSR